MKPITEEQQQALISHGQELKERMSENMYPKDFGLRTIQIIEIAIASLMAEPVGYTYDRSIGCEIVAADIYDSAKINCDLYTTPSVPVIKLPPYQTQLNTDMGQKSDWNRCIDVIKRLNGMED